jgi:hypothetical protein
MMISARTIAPARAAVFSLILLAIGFVALEAISFAAYLAIRSKYFDVPPSRETFASQLREQYEAQHFDENTGWVLPKQAANADGTRLSPDNPAGAPCLSMYGDSFVFGSEVDDEHSWGNQIAKRLSCRVQNYGVPGYGTDQAYLRFLHNDADHASQVILNILFENVARNVNQNRGYLLAVAYVGPLKPVFHFDEQNKLKLEPIPRLGLAAYDDFVRDPRLIFSRDYFVPGQSPYAKPRIGFPYSVGVIGALASKRLKDSLVSTFVRRPPWWEDLKDPSHPSRAIEITEAIIDQFVQVARERGKRPIVSFLPTAREYPTRFWNGRWVYSGLYDWCQSKGYECFDAGTALVERIGASQLQSVEGICRYFCPSAYLGGHYNQRGNALLAEVTADYLAVWATHSAPAGR